MSLALSASSVGRSSLGSRAPRETLGFACFCNAVDAMCVSNPVGRTDGFNLKKKKEESIRLSARPACLPLAAWTRIHRLYCTVLSCPVLCMDRWPGLLLVFVPLPLSSPFFLCVCAVCVYTSLIGDHARVIEEQVTESVTVGIDGWFSAQARRVEYGERLQSPQSRLAFGHRRCRTRHCVLLSPKNKKQRGRIHTLLFFKPVNFDMQIVNTTRKRQKPITFGVIKKRNRSMLMRIYSCARVNYRSVPCLTFTSSSSSNDDDDDDSLNNDSDFIMNLGLKHVTSDCVRACVGGGG